MASPDVRARIIKAGPEKEINIFIHGYMAATNKETQDGLIQQIQKKSRPGTSYLMDWPAGSEFIGTSIVVVRWAYRIGSKLKLLNPAALLIDLSAGVLANAVQFKIHQQRADELGRSLGTLLKSWLWCRKKKINLIGHSLGARVIQQALLHANLDESTIRDCVLLGGAADTNPETWRQCANRIEGSIYNFYSDADKVLLITPDITKWVGRNPIECGSPNIHNIHKSGWGHGDYWKKIDQILYADWPTPDEHEAGR